MEVDFAFLCDYADGSSNKLHALGLGIDTLCLKEVPGIHNGFFAVIQFRFTSVETGRKDVALRMLDPDGENVVPPFEGKLEVTAQPGTTVGTARWVTRFQPLLFRKWGDHAVVWLVQGQEAKRVAFRVAQPPETS